MRIVINGSLGSGKSTVAKIIVDRLGYKYYSTGSMFRQMAAEAGVDIIEFSKMAENDPSIDERIDNWLKSLNYSDENIIIDSRMAPHFIKDAIKVKLNVNEKVGAKRIHNDTNRGKTERFLDFQDALEGYRTRKASEDKRYIEAYDIDPYDESIFDIVIDTSDITPEEVADLIIQQIESLD